MKQTMTKDVALLVLRLAGLGLAFAHGWGKIAALASGEGGGFIEGVGRLGFRLVATRGTAAFLESNGLSAERVFKVNEGRPHIVDLLISGKVDLVVNTPLGRKSFYDEEAIRMTAIQRGVLCITTLTGANATVAGIEALKRGRFDLRSLQEIHQEVITKPSQVTGELGR